MEKSLKKLKYSNDSREIAITKELKVKLTV